MRAASQRAARSTSCCSLVNGCASVIVALSVCHPKSWSSGIWTSGNPLARVPSTQSTKFGDNRILTSVNENVRSAVLT